MTNQFDYDLTMQATDQVTDIAYQPEQISNEELEGVVAGSGFGLFHRVIRPFIHQLTPTNFCGGDDCCGI